MPEQFNQLTPAEAERLAMLAEEAAEVIQIVGKILRHGYNSHHPNGGPDNRGLLQHELRDFEAIRMAMTDAGDINSWPGHHWNNRAWAGKLRYTHHQ